MGLILKSDSFITDFGVCHLSIQDCVKERSCMKKQLIRIKKNSKKKLIQAIHLKKNNILSFQQKKKILRKINFLCKIPT